MFSVIHLPDFSLQSVLRHRPEWLARPVALMEETGGKAVVWQMTLAAREAGVGEGMTSTQAMARCPGIGIQSRSPAQENAAMQGLLQCAQAFSPAIEATAPGVCTMDLKGVAGAGRDGRRTFNIERGTSSLWAEWAGRLGEQIEFLGLRGGIGIAETPELALLAARQANPFLLVEEREEFLAGLPMEEIGASPEISGILRKWGIRTVGEFAALGKGAIAERLGAEALELFERAADRTVRPLNLTQPAESFEELVEFGHEIESLEPLLFVLRRLVDQISGRLEMRALAAEELVFRLTLSQGEPYERRFRIPAPTARADALFRTIHTHLETVRTAAPIVALRLAAIPCRSRNHQFDLFESSLRDPGRFHETLARLSALLGAERVGTPVVQAGHRPDAFEMRAPEFDRAGKGGGNGRETKRPYGPSLRRFRPPVPIRVTIHERRPAHISGPAARGAIEAAAGPWRRSGDWWDDGRRWERDEWDVQTGEGVCRIFQSGGQWFLEGVYD